MELSQQLVVIGLVLAVFAGALTLAHRRGLVRLNLPVRSHAVRKLELLDRLALTPQHGVHFIRADGQVILIATYPGGIEWLSSNENGSVRGEKRGTEVSPDRESQRRTGRGAGY